MTPLHSRTRSTRTNRLNGQYVDGPFERTERFWNDSSYGGAIRKLLKAKRHCLTHSTVSLLKLLANVQQLSVAVGRAFFRYERAFKWQMPTQQPPSWCFYWSKTFMSWFKLRDYGTTCKYFIRRSSTWWVQYGMKGWDGMETAPKDQGWCIRNSPVIYVRQKSYKAQCSQVHLARVSSIEGSKRATWRLVAFESIMLHFIRCHGQLQQKRGNNYCTCTKLWLLRATPALTNTTTTAHHYETASMER